MARPEASIRNVGSMALVMADAVILPGVACTDPKMLIPAVVGPLGAEVAIIVFDKVLQRNGGNILFDNQNQDNPNQE